MRQLLFIVIGLNTSLSIGQSENPNFTSENFETEFFDYTPVNKKNKISQKDFEWATFVISETQKSLKNDVKNYNVTHYWNIISAFDVLDLDKKYLEMVFLKLANSGGSCTYITSYKDKIEFDDKIPDLYDKYYNVCNKKGIEKSSFNIEDYVHKNNLDHGLVKIVRKIDLNDQKYRSSDEEEFKTKQPLLDKQNQILIDSLFSIHGKYIGKSLVGEKYKHTMWSVIQHSNIEMMEKYLPFVHQAFKNGDLAKTPVKMLIDRLYGLKYGYQVFGSQNGFGFKMADEPTRKKITKKYSLE